METLEKETAAGKPRKVTARNSELVKRGNSYSIHPHEIVINWGSNLREDYGEDFPELKESIKERGGLLQNIKLYVDSNGKFALRHGFRRMKAVLELIEEGLNIESVPFDEVPNNEEEALIEHFILNTGKKLSDVEMANGLKKLKIISGITNVAELARKVSIPYQKAITLLDFADHAGSQVQQSILKGETSFDVGRRIVKSAGSVSEQNELLEIGKENALKSGKKKIRTKHIPIAHPTVTSTTSFDASLTEVMETAKKMEGLDKTFYNRVNNLINLVKIGAPSEEVMLLFIP